MTKPPSEKMPCEEERPDAEPPACPAEEVLRARAEEVVRREAEIDLTSLNQALTAPVKMAIGREAPQPDYGEHLDEIADDVLELLKQMKALQVGLQGLGQRLDSLEQAVGGMAHAHGRELHAIRGELAWERRALAAVNVFEALSGPLEQFRRMRAGLHPKKDKRTIDQLDAVVNILDRVVRTLGFESFEVRPGEPFDPQRMACRGYLEGKPGVVLKALKPGYRAERYIVRPAEVMIADPAAAAEAHSNGGETA